MRRSQVNGGSRATLGTEAICEMLGIVSRLRRPHATDFDNYRRANPELAQRLLADCKARYPLGTFERSREILQIIANSSPTKELTSAYFENTESLLESRSRRSVPGTIVLGTGTGRCGSTSLVALLGTVENSCTTHENPPLVYWTPQPEQLEFHFRRFKLLADYFQLAFDASHWWLNSAEPFLREFPNGRIIGLHRETSSCAQSFMKIKGHGRRSINNWVTAPNNIWRLVPWNLTYPDYDCPAAADRDPDGAKLDMIFCYITDYNTRLTVLAERHPERVLLVRTEDLSRRDQQERIFDFVGCAGKVSSLLLNVGTTADGENQQFKF